MPQYTVDNYCKVEITPQNRCSGTGRRFKGTMKGQYNPANCPICKVPADYLGMAGVTSVMASSQRIVVPEHAHHARLGPNPTMQP
jgi:hypothetical protein